MVLAFFFPVSEWKEVRIVARKMGKIEISRGKFTLELFFVVSTGGWESDYS